VKGERSVETFALESRRGGVSGTVHGLAHKGIRGVNLLTRGFWPRGKACVGFEGQERGINSKRKESRTEVYGGFRCIFVKRKLAGGLE